MLQAKLCNIFKEILGSRRIFISKACSDEVRHNAYCRVGRRHMCILTQTFAAWLFLCQCMSTTRFKNKVLFDPALEKHIAQCNQVGCQCKRFRRNYFNWACRLPVDRKDEKRSTWLSFDLSGNAFKWSCTVCDAKGADYANKAGMALYTGLHYALRTLHLTRSCSGTLQITHSLRKPFDV